MLVVLFFIQYVQLGYTGMHARRNVDIVKIILSVNIQMDCVLLVVTMAIMETFVKPVRVMINECQ